MKRKYLVYIGYYEALVSFKKLKEPYFFAGRFSTLWEAYDFLDKNYPSADVLLDKDVAETEDWYKQDDERDNCPSVVNL